MRCLIPMFCEEGWEYHGEFFDFPLRNVVPKPHQKPHPPLWVACSQLDTIEMAGRAGPGRARLPVRLGRSGPRLGERLLQRVHQAARPARADYQTNPNIAVVSQFMCAPTDEEARARADGSTFFQFALALLQHQGPGRSRHRQPVGRVPGVEADARGPGGPARRPHRLARHDPRRAAQVRGVQRRPGHPAEPGRHATATSTSASARAVRRGGHAGVPRARARAPGVEAGGAGRRARPRRDRHRRRTTW